MKKKIISSVIFLIVATIISMLFQGFEIIDIVDTAFAFHPIFSAMERSDSTLFLCIVWLVPMLIILSIAFAELCDFFQKKITYFVLRNRSYFNSYLFVSKKVCGIVAGNVLIYYLVTVFVSGQFDYLVNIRYIGEMIKYSVVLFLLWQILAVFYFVVQREVVITYYILIVILLGSMSKDFFVSKTIMCQMITSNLFSDIILLVVCNISVIGIINMLLKSHRVR